MNLTFKKIDCFYFATIVLVKIYGNLFVPKRIQLSLSQKSTISRLIKFI